MNGELQSRLFVIGYEEPNPLAADFLDMEA